MKDLAVDLETIADPLAISMLPEPKPKGNLKDPEKIKADIADKKAKQIAKMGLEPFQSLICVFGWENNKGESGQIKLKDDKSERTLLKEAWGIIKQHDRLISFNGNGFDVPMMKIHSILNQITPTMDISTKKYGSLNSNHIDLRNILFQGDAFAKGTLDFICKRVLGIGKTEGMDGSLVQGYWDDGRIDEIAAYCKDDVSRTMELFERMKPVFNIYP